MTDVSTEEGHVLLFQEAILITSWWITTRSNELLLTHLDQCNNNDSHAEGRRLMNVELYKSEHLDEL